MKYCENCGYPIKEYLVGIWTWKRLAILFCCAWLLTAVIGIVNYYLG